MVELKPAEKDFESGSPSIPGFSDLNTTRPTENINEDNLPAQTAASESRSLLGDGSVGLAALTGGGAANYGAMNTSRAPSCCGHDDSNKSH